jgi:hypothetical protein
MSISRVIENEYDPSEMEIEWLITYLIDLVSLKYLW